MNEKTHEELDQIESTLLVECSDNPIELKERLATVATYHSRLGRMLVDAKKELRLQKVSEIGTQIVEIAKTGFLAASAQKALVDSICIEQQYLVDRIERLQSSCVHDIDASRSILSYVKEELKNLNYNTH